MSNSLKNVIPITLDEEYEKWKKKMKEEIQENSEEAPQNFTDQIHMPPNTNPLFTVSYEMGWHRKASGHLYNKICCHNFIIGVCTGKILSDIVVAKKYTRCSIS